MTPRRVRMCACNYCGHVFKWQRYDRKKDDMGAGAFQMCPECFKVDDGNTMHTWLEHRHV